MAWRKGILIASGIGGSAFGIRELVTRNQLVDAPKDLSSPVEQASEHVLETPVVTPTSEIANQLELQQDTQQVSDLSHLQREERKKKAEELIKKLDDYTFKLFTNCNYGTGWILDYQLPKEKGRYPLVWYIATNAHVIDDYGFRENPYNQEMALDYKTINDKNNFWKSRVSFRNFSLSRDTSCAYRDYYGWFDFNISKQSDGEQIRSDESAVSLGKIKAPRLFYVSIDLLNNGTSTGVTKGTHFKDFAVIEVEFTDEDYAKKATREFATKYPLESTDAINVFGKTLEERDNWDKEEGPKEEDFISLGYPTIQGRPFDQKVTWDYENLRGERLSNDPYNWYTDTTKNKKIKGFMDAKRFTIKYGQKQLQYFGHMYLTRGHLLKGGSSGSMYVDFDGNLIGLKSWSEEGAHEMHSFIEPIRSKAINKESINTPEYDLIVGANGQKSSYKSQFEQHLKNKNIETWLSRRGWKHITKDNVHTVKDLAK